MSAIRTAWGAGLWGGFDADDPATWKGTPWVLEEVTGRKRRVELSGNALPMQPIDLPMERDVRTFKYPGQPETTQHVLGYGLGATTVHGRWMSGELAEADLAVLFLNGDTSKGQSQKSVEDLRELLYDIVRSCQRVAVTWCGMRRETSAFTFTPRIRTRDFIEWEMSFEWAGEAKVVDLPVKDPVVEAPFSLFDAISDLLDLAKYPALVALDLLDFVQAQVARAEALIVELRDVIELYVSGVENLIGVSVRAVGLLESIKAAGRSIRDRVSGLSAEAAALGTKGGDPGEHAVRERIREWLRSTQRDSTKLTARAASQQELFLRVQDPRLEGVVITQGVTDLRHLAVTAGWPADKWTVIADYNGLLGSVVPAGTTVLIPKRPEA